MSRLYLFRPVVIACCMMCCLSLPRQQAQAQKQWVEEPTLPSPVAGQKRLALIIGNTHYGGVRELKNPENDAKSISLALGKLGFSSTVVLDASRTVLRDTFHSFASRIRSAGPSAIALLFYSGHGMQIDGENYLIPVDFQMPTFKEDIADIAFSVQKAITEMQSAEAQVNIVILDACRDNPFSESKSVSGKGLAKLETRGVLIAFATEAGRTASDNKVGSNGLYTSKLLENLKKPGLKLYEVFKATGKAVYEASHHEQFPYLYDGLIDDDAFYLYPSPTASVKPVNAATPPVKTESSFVYVPIKRTNPRDGAEMILIPAGRFVMGSDEPNLINVDNHQRLVTTPQYFIYKNLVTVRMYEKFCKITKRKMPPAPEFNPHWSKKEHPIVNVSWEDARSYCDWAGVKLPTEAQWEKAARGTDGRRFPWGNEWDEHRLWCSPTLTGLAAALSKGTEKAGTARVGSFPSGASPYGVLDMEGNVWQWCADWYDPSEQNKVLKGGGWGNSIESLFWSSFRSGDAPTSREETTGFRCAQ